MELSAKPRGPTGPVERGEADPHLKDMVRVTLNLRTSSVQNLALPETEGPELTTSVEIEGRSWTLVLRKHTIRSDDFQVLMQVDRTGRLVRFEPPPVVTYRGSVVEAPEAVVSASYRDGRLHAVIHTPSGGYGIEPLSNAGVAADPAAHIVYSASDWVNEQGHTCGTTDGPSPFNSPNQWAAGGSARGGVGLRVCTIGCDSDFEFFEKNGGDVAATVFDIENVMNSVAARYEVQSLGITYQVSTIIVRTVPGAPYTSSVSGFLLCQFRLAWNFSPHAHIQRDTAHLFTGKDLAGTAIGAAFVGVICNERGETCGSTNDMAYALSESRFEGASFEERVTLTAHELGHNWNASHCDGTQDCRTMCSDPGECSGEIVGFGPQATAQIVDFKYWRTCLDDGVEPHPLPFFDDFPTAGLDPNKWTYVKGARVNGDAVDEPSPERSLMLNAAGTGEFRDDQIRSNTILLGGAAGAPLSYYTQHRGVESGEALIVEYRDDNRAWVEINRIVSDGMDQETFEFHSHELLFDALHDGFRVRFRVEVNEANDAWFVDDVRVAECETDIFGDANFDGKVDILDIFCVLDGFQGIFLPLCGGFEVVDLSPCDGDGKIDILDIFAVLDAFRGDPSCPGPCVDQE